MKEEFKKFVNNHPELIKYVNSGEMTWQKFYEMYSLYGDKQDAWNNYLKQDNKATSIQDIVEAIKKVDVDQFQKNISTINKALAFVGTLFTKDEVTDTYTPRPLYKKFED